MPWLRVNHTRLCWFSAVPTPVFALDVQRGSIPGHPGANCSESLTSCPRVSAIISVRGSRCFDPRLQCGVASSHNYAYGKVSPGASIEGMGREFQDLQP